MANPDSMREIARLFGVSRSTIHRCIRRVLQTIFDVLTKKLIVWPDQATQRQVSRRIAFSHNINNVIGFIDGTHIWLAAIPQNDSDYNNRKGFPLLQLQFVVNDQLMIIDVHVGWPGCVHDSCVHRNLPLYGIFILCHKDIEGAQLDQHVIQTSKT